MKSKSIAESGIFIALTIIILYSASYLSINTVAFLTVASSIIPISTIRNNIKYSFFIYLSSSILAVFLIPIKITIFYILFFGIYGILKYYIERLNRLHLEIILKLFSFNLIAFIIYFFFKKLIINLSSINIPIWTAFLVIQILFLIYDYALTLIISIYLDKIHNK